MYTFGTVEDFWGLFNNLLEPSKMAVGSDAHLFREGIEPKWEDPSCAAGGKWLFAVPKGASPSEQADSAWLRVVLACIGEHFADGDEVCGVVVNVRPRDQYRVALWTRTAANEAVQSAIGKQFKELVGAQDMPISFISHADAKMTGKPPAKYIV